MHLGEELLISCLILNYYKHNPKVKLDTNLKKNFIIFILYKEFNLWYESIKRNPADFFLKLNKFNIKPMTINDKKKLKKYHKDFYDFWILNARKTKNIEFVNFREVLNDDNNQLLLSYLKKKYNLSKAPEIISFKGFPAYYWIFNEIDYPGKSDKLIILFNLNENNEPKFNIKNFKVIDNYKNNCLLLERS